MNVILMSEQNPVREWTILEKPDFLVLKKLGYRKKMFEDYQRSIKTRAGLEKGKLRQGDGCPVSKKQVVSYKA